MSILDRLKEIIAETPDRAALRETIARAEAQPRPDFGIEYCESARRGEENRARRRAWERDRQREVDRARAQLERHPLPALVDFRAWIWTELNTLRARPESYFGGEEVALERRVAAGEAVSEAMVWARDAWSLPDGEIADGIATRRARLLAAREAPPAAAPRLLATSADRQAEEARRRQHPVRRWAS